MLIFCEIARRNKCYWCVWWKYKAGHRLYMHGVNHLGTTENSLLRWYVSSEEELVEWLMDSGKSNICKVGLQITVDGQGIWCNRSQRASKEKSCNTCTDPIQASTGALNHTVATPVQCITWITSAIVWASTDTVSTPPITLCYTPS